MRGAFKPEAGSSGRSSGHAGNSSNPAAVDSQSQKEENVSGVFEGIAGTGGNVIFTSATSMEQESQSASEFFRDKSISEDQASFAVNQHLGKEPNRVEFSGVSEDGLMLKKISPTTASQLETPIERTTRLQREVTEMVTFIQRFMESRNSEIRGSEATLSAGEAESRHTRLRAHMLEEGHRFFGADPDILLKELNSLRACLDGIALFDGFQPSAETGKGIAEQKPTIHAGVSLEATASDLIKSQLEAAEAVAKKVSVKQSEPGKLTSPFTFEFFSLANVKEGVDATRIVELEKRLGELEEQLGINRGGQFSLPFSDISSALKEIVSRLALLHPSRLDGLTKRFQALGVQVDDLIRRRERLSLTQSLQQTGGQQDQGDRIKQQAISNLYDFCESTRPATAALPVIVKRLKALKVLHNEASSLSSRLNALEAQQSDLSKLLNTSQTHFDELRDAVQKNITWAKDIVNDLEKWQS